MENDVYYKELSDKKLEIGQQDVLVGVLAPQLVNIPLEVQVVPADKPESPSASPPTPSPVQESPPQQLGDAPSFLEFFTSDDLVDLDQWWTPRVSGVLRTCVWMNRRSRQFRRPFLGLLGALNGNINSFRRRGGPHL